MAKRGRKPKPVPGLDEEFMAMSASMNTADIKTRILTLHSQVLETKDYLKNNSTIKSAREELAELVGPGKDAIKVCENRMKYFHDMLVDRGASETGTV